MLLTAMAGLISIVLGLFVNTAGVFFSPIAEEYGVGRASVSMTSTIGSIVMAFSGMLTAKMIRPQNFKRSLILWLAVMILATAALAVCPNIYLMYVLFAIRGFAGGLLGLVLVSPIINSWFYEKVGMFTSLCVGFSGLTGAVFSPVMTSLIASIGWRMAEAVSAGLMLIFALPAVLFPIAMTPEDAGTLPYGEKVQTVETKKTGNGGKADPILFALVAGFAILACYGTAMPPHFPGAAESFGLSAATGAMMLSLAMIANTSGKVLLGILSDMIGTKISMMLFLVMVTAGALCMALIHTPLMMYVGAVLIGMSYGMGSVGNVLAVKDIFGDELYSSVYPKITLLTTLSNSLATTLNGSLYDISGGYVLPLMVLAPIPVVAILLLIMAYKKK